ncbi:MAG: hypothetical protein HYT64_00300 [Candidatus Yanofskybacteria bacterium]|nr:hypothetical protein [Candidatus Yanofskybacteria bacterium]
MRSLGKVLLICLLLVSVTFVGCGSPTSPTTLDLNSEELNRLGERLDSATATSDVSSVEPSCGNPDDLLPDDSALQDCLDRGGEILLQPGSPESPGYIVNGLNGDPTRGLIIKSNTRLTSASGRARIIAGRDLKGFILKTSPGGANNFEIQNISFDGMLDAVTSTGLYRVPEKNCNAGNLALEGSNFRFVLNESKHALCGTGLILFGSSYDIQHNYIAFNGTDYLSGGPWSDGITALYCDRGYIAHNTFIDNTDIDLVVGGGYGCVVELNTIAQYGKHAFSGLNIGNMASSASGDHSGSSFRGNTIYSSSPNRMSMGISVGSHMWNKDVWVSNAGEVKDNTVYGADVNIVVDGIRGGTVANNNFRNPVRVASDNCNHSGYDYIVNSPHAIGAILQPGWTELSYDSDVCPPAPKSDLRISNWMQWK